MPSYTIGLDLGQRSDYSALAVIEEPLWLTTDEYQPNAPSGWVSPADVRPMDRWRIVPSQARPILALKHLQRWALGTPYPSIVRDVAQLLVMPPLAGNSVLVVDYTGVGRPIGDLFTQAKIAHIALTITGGSAVTEDGTEIRVPKRDLAMAVQVLLQNRRLVFAGGLPLLDVLKKELQSFEVKINPATAHDSYLSWREGAHDDLVLAVAMSVWYREWRNPEGMEGFSYSTDGRRAAAPKLRHGMANRPRARN